MVDDNNNRVEEEPADISCHPPQVVDGADDRDDFDSSVRSIDRVDRDSTAVEDRRGAAEDRNPM